MPRIPQLASATSADSNDELPFEDVSSSTTKKITKADYLKDTATYMTTGSISTSNLADNSVTTGKLDHNSMGRVFARRLTSAQSIPNNSQTTLVFNSISENDGSAYNSTTGVYTAPSAGLAIINARVTMQESVVISLRVIHNGSVVVSEDTPATGAYMTKSISVSLRLAASDTVSIAVFQNSGSGKNAHSDPATTNVTITRI